MPVAVGKVHFVAQNVRRLRHERGYSQSELARRAALAKQTLSGIEAGEANPTVLTLATIADALQVPVSHLLIDHGSLVSVQRSRGAAWTAGADCEVRQLEQMLGLGHARAAIVRYARGDGRPTVHRQHRLGTVHHAYVLSGDASMGLVGDQVEVSSGDFIRFPGDLPHQVCAVSPELVIHMITTVPRGGQEVLLPSERE